jgi:hypothetical protein
MTQETVSLERRFSLWLGALLLNRGHVVELPNGKLDLYVRTGQKARRLRLSIRDEPVSRTNGRAMVGKITDLQEDIPDAIVMISENGSVDSISVVPVHQTKDGWINEGRHYTIPAEQLVDFDRLDNWLTKLGRPIYSQK